MLTFWTCQFVFFLQYFHYSVWFSFSYLFYGKSIYLRWLFWNSLLLKVEVLFGLVRVYFAIQSIRLCLYVFNNHWLTIIIIYIFETDCSLWKALQCHLLYKVCIYWIMLSLSYYMNIHKLCNKIVTDCSGEFAIRCW